MGAHLFKPERVGCVKHVCVLGNGQLGGARPVADPCRVFYAPPMHAIWGERNLEREAFAKGVGGVGGVGAIGGVGAQVVEVEDIPVGGTCSTGHTCGGHMQHGT